MSNNKKMDYYEILEVHRNASYEVINRAYKTLVMKYHPDVNADNIEYANVKMHDLNNAYEVLRDERKRNAYNIIFDAENNKANNEREREREREREKEREREREREREKEREREREREKEREREREREKERERQNYDNREPNEDSGFYKKDVKPEYGTEDNSYEVYNKKNEGRVKSSFGKGVILIAAVFLIIVTTLSFNEDYGNKEVVYENTTVDLEKLDKKESLVNNEHVNELDELDVLSSLILFLKDQNEGYKMDNYIDFTNEFTKSQSIMGFVNTENLNIQKGPSNDYEIIYIANKEEAMFVIGMVNDWYNVYILDEKYEGYGWSPIKYTDSFWFDWDKEEISNHIINIERELIEVGVNESNNLTNSKVNEDVFSTANAIKDEVSEKSEDESGNSLETNKIVEKQNFTIGSSKEDVTNAMGTPSSVNSYSFGDTWNYDLSTIEFDTNGKVKGWKNHSNNLKVVLGKGTDNASLITIGSSKEDVTNAMGTPSSVNSYSFGDTWNYDLSTIEFDTNGKVKGWKNHSNNLKVVLGKGSDNASLITIGSSKEDVTNAMGTPSSVNSYSFGDTWNYDLSTIEFDTNGKVKGWKNHSNNLKVN